MTGSEADGSARGGTVGTCGSSSQEEKFLEKRGTFVDDLLAATDGLEFGSEEWHAARERVVRAAGLTEEALDGLRSAFKPARSRSGTASM